VDAALGVGNDHERFPVGIEKYLTLRYYTLLHTELYGVCENDPILLATPKVPKFVCPTCLLGRQKSWGNFPKKKVLLEL
jgi:hypothetical protein